MEKYGQFYLNYHQIPTSSTSLIFSTDPKADTKLKFDGKEVVVPQGKPKNNPDGSGSHFSQSEYLVYRESQNRIRYLLLMDF